MRDYGKVHTSFWTSNSIRELSEDGRTLAFYLLTCPHGNISGVFRLPDGYVCEDLQWDAERVSKGFENIVSKGFANRCETTKWVQIINHFEWNPPENPNQKKAALKIAQQIPESCSWKADFIYKSWDYLGLSNPEAEGLLNPFETVSKPVTVTVTGTVLNTSPIGDGGSNPDKQASPTPAQPVDSCPHQQIIDLYHAKLPMGVHVRQWTPARQQALRTRWREDSARQDLQWWDLFFGYVAESRFLTGKVSSRDRRPFEISLDWLCKSENFTKVLEGRYHSEEVAA